MKNISKKQIIITIIISILLSGIGFISGLYKSIDRKK